MGNGGDDDALGANAIEDGVRSAADDEFADSWFSSDPAEIRIDAYPGQVVHGKVVEIAPASGSQFALLPPDNATGNYTKVVQRVPVKIAVNDDDSRLAAKLRPGLSVIATVRTRH